MWSLKKIFYCPRIPSWWENDQKDCRTNWTQYQKWQKMYVRWDPTAARTTQWDKLDSVHTALEWIKNFICQISLAIKNMDTWFTFWCFNQSWDHLSQTSHLALISIIIFIRYILVNIHVIAFAPYHIFLCISSFNSQNHFIVTWSKRHFHSYFIHNKKYLTPSKRQSQHT